MSLFKSYEDKIQTMFPTAVLLVLAGGFALNLAELLLMHHGHGKQAIALWATGLGTALSLVGLFAKGKLRDAVVLGFLAVMATGVLGTVFHLKGDEEEEGERHALMLIAPAHAETTASTSPLAQGEEDEEEEEDEKSETAAFGESEASGSMLAVAAERGGRGEHEEEEGEEGEDHAPPLAPLGITGLALLGALAVVAKRDR